jgi:hypothetical protein
MRIFAATALLLATAIAGCGYEAPLPDGTLAPSGIDGVWVAGEILPAKQGFVVEGEVENRRGSALVLQPDACGHALVAVLQHTSQRLDGRRWASPSVQALKDLVLARQIKEDQRREVALTAAAPCEPRSAPVTLAPGQELHQRWTVKRSVLLDEFGIVHAKVVVRVTEPGDRFPSGAQGPLLGIVDWPARRPRTSPAEHFDRLLDDPGSTTSSPASRPRPGRAGRSTSRATASR